MSKSFYPFLPPCIMIDFLPLLPSFNQDWDWWNHCNWCTFGSQSIRRCWSEIQSRRLHLPKVTVLYPRQSPFADITLQQTYIWCIYIYINNHFFYSYQMAIHVLGVVISERDRRSDGHPWENQQFCSFEEGGELTLRWILYPLSGRGKPGNIWIASEIPSFRQKVNMISIPLYIYI